MLKKIFPFLSWFSNYNKNSFKSDLFSGITVALVLIPQSMAYAQIAGLPAYYGLYASFLPPMIASLFGSSRMLSTGPVAMVSLMSAVALESVATAGTEGFIAYAILLSLLVGLFQFIIGLFRMGIIINFISHPVIVGFTNAGVIIIATTQLGSLFGITVEKSSYHFNTVYNTLSLIREVHLPCLLLGLSAIIIILTIKHINEKLPAVLIAVIITTFFSWLSDFEKTQILSFEDIKSMDLIDLINEYNTETMNLDDLMSEKLGVSKQIYENDSFFRKSTEQLFHLGQREALLNYEILLSSEAISKLREQLRRLIIRRSRNDQGDYEYYLNNDHINNVIFDNTKWKLSIDGKELNNNIRIDGGGHVIGNIPGGLPAFEIPRLEFSVIFRLFPMAVLISLIGFMESIAVARTLASKTGQRIDTNQELIGQGLANIIGSFNSSYPVSGSFSRSALNNQSGAVSGMSGVFTSIVVLITLLFFTPFLYHLPKSVLAGILMIAVLSILNIRGFFYLWKETKIDGIIALITFFSTLIFAPELEKGILTGVFLSFAHSLYIQMHPDIRVLSKHWEGGFKDAKRWDLERCKYLSVIRFNGALTFENSEFLENKIRDELNSNPEMKHIIIAGIGLSDIDATG
ncbi:SulP family inorganic anion transporter, partial [candidate division KSB1 bacterium]